MAAAGSGPSLSSSTLGVLQTTRPIDRLRYQAKLLFDFLDTDHDGQLTSSQVGEYVDYCSQRFGGSRADLDALYAPLLASAQPLGFEDFVELVRSQVAAVSSNSKFAESQLKGAELGRLLYKCAITTRDLAKALAVFKLLDFNNDGFLRVDELAKAQGIEKRVFDDVLEDADENNDGLLSFEDFLSSYAKERPVFLSMAVMAAHTLAFYLVLNSPLDYIFKALIAGLLLLKPALITNPVIKIYQILAAIFNRGRAELEVTGTLGGGSPSTA